MNTLAIIQVIGFSLPAISALVCFSLMTIYNHDSNDSTQKRLSTIMIFTYLSAFLCWLGVILYMVDYDGFVLYNTLFFLALMADQVLLYRFLFSITGTGKREKFNRIHYIIPIVLVIIMGIWSLLTPYDVQYYIVESRGENAPGYLWYSLFFSATIPIFIVYNIIYPLLGLLRVRVYRRVVVNYSADEQRASARWLYRLILLIWLTLPLASGAIFVHKNVFFSSILIIPGALIPIFQYLIICYNLMSGNYIIIRTSHDEEGKARNIDRKKFEAYIKENRPYLNSKLKITDLCTALGTNRTYLSSYINSEYGMNFSRYINLQRLNELEKIRVDHANKNTSGIDLVLQAGFSNYRSYIRVKNSEDARKTVGF